MGEGIIVEKRELPTEYEVRGRNMRGVVERVGVFRFIKETGEVEFLPNSEIDPVSQIEIIEPIFRCRIYQDNFKEGERGYHGIFPQELAYMNLSFNIMIGQPDRKGIRKPIIRAEMGRFGDEYQRWELSENEWKKMDAWLSTHFS